MARTKALFKKLWSLYQTAADKDKRLQPRVRAVRGISAIVDAVVSIVQVQEQEVERLIENCERAKGHHQQLSDAFVDLSKKHTEALSIIVEKNKECETLYAALHEAQHRLQLAGLENAELRARLNEADNNASQCLVKLFQLINILDRSIKT